MSNKVQTSQLNKWLRRLYLAAMVVMVFTGFGNMPLYKRYYVSNLPGLSWASDFVANLQVHYLAGAVLLAVAAYLALDWILTGRRLARLTTTGLIRVVLLAGVVLSGGMMALRNLDSFKLGFASGVTFTLGHMMMVMVFLFFSLGCLIARSRWLRPA